MKIRTLEVELFHVDGRTQGRTDMTKVTGAFLNVANTSQNCTICPPSIRHKIVLSAHPPFVTKLYYLPTLYSSQNCTICPPSIRHKIVLSAHPLFLRVVFISEQTATFALHDKNVLAFMTEMKSVYCAVRTGSSNKAVCASSLKD